MSYGLLSSWFSPALLCLPVKRTGYLIFGSIVLVGAAWLAWAILRDS
jgi:hypothetical protein